MDNTVNQADVSLADTPGRNSAVQPRQLDPSSTFQLSSSSPSEREASVKDEGLDERDQS